MFDARKDFYTTKARQLLLYYVKTRKFAKARFISELIECQEFFGTKSILNYEILLRNNYQRNTIEAVLSDLNYSIISLKPEINCSDGTKKILPIISFGVKEGA